MPTNRWPARSFPPNGNIVVVAWSFHGVRSGPARTRTTAQTAIAKLIKKLERSDNPKELLSNHGNKRFIAMESAARLDEDKIREAERWDGLQGIVTNIRDMPHRELFARYRDLWQVEESFRVTKHDLRVRPIFHWVPGRVQAHLAISFMAFACIRHLSYRVALQKQRISPEVIRSALIHRQCSVLKHKRTGRRYVVPSKPTPNMEKIYDTMGLALSATPYELD